MSGVRSSWLASATNWRIRSSERRAAASDRVRASNDVSIWASMLFSDRPSRPTSVAGSWSGTRRDRSPAAMACAVFSMSVSGRRLARTIAMPTTARPTTMITLTIRSIPASWLMVPLMSPRSTPAIRVALTLCAGPRNPAETVTVCWIATTRQLSLPVTALTLTRRPWLAWNQLLEVGTSGSDVPGWMPSCAATSASDRPAGMIATRYGPEGVTWGNG